MGIWGGGGGGGGGGGLHMLMLHLEKRINKSRRLPCHMLLLLIN